MLRAARSLQGAWLLHPHAVAVRAAGRRPPSQPFATQADHHQHQMQRKQQQVQQQKQLQAQAQAQKEAQKKQNAALAAAQKQKKKGVPQPDEKAQQPQPTDNKKPRSSRRSQSAHPSPVSAAGGVAAAPAPAPAPAPASSPRSQTPAVAHTQPANTGKSRKANKNAHTHALDATTNNNNNSLTPAGTQPPAVDSLATDSALQAKGKSKAKPASSSSTAHASARGRARPGSAPLAVYEDNPAARHELLHELCSTLLPSQTRALSLLLYLCKAVNQNGVALIDFMRYAYVRPLGRSSNEKTKAHTALTAEATAFHKSDTKRPSLMDVTFTQPPPPPHHHGQTPDALALSSSVSARASGNSSDEWVQGGPGPRPPAHRMHPEKRLELQSMYAKVEAHAAADLQNHLAKVKAEERRLQAQAALLRPQATAPITPTREHWLRLSDDAVQRHAAQAHQEGEEDATSLMLLRSTRIDSQLFRSARQFLAAKEKEEAILAIGTVASPAAKLTARQSLFLVEASRIMCSYADTFLTRLMHHYAHMTAREFEAVRLLYPEAETNPFLAFKVHRANEEAPTPTPMPEFGTKWTGSQPVSPPQPMPKSLPDGLVAATPLQLPLTNTPPFVKAACELALPRTVYINQWRTSFGPRGSFDSMPPLDYSAPAFSLSNDLHSEAARSWLEPLSTPEGISRKLLVRHLHPEISVAELVHAFSVFGEVEAGEIHREQLAEEMEHHHPHVLDTNGKSGGKTTAREAKRRIDSEKEKAARSSVYAFIYFRDAAAVALATEPAPRLFGVHIKGFTVFPQAAREKTSLTVTLKRQTIHDMFHRAFPRAHAHSAALDLTPNPDLKPSETIAPLAALGATPAGVITTTNGFPNVASLGLAHLGDTPMLFRSALQEYAWSQLQQDILSSLAAVGLASESQSLQFSSRQQLLDHGLQIDCRTHQLAERVFRVLAGRPIAGHAVTLAWTPSRVHKFDSRHTEERTDRRTQELHQEQMREKRERERAAETRLQSFIRGSMPRPDAAEPADATTQPSPARA